MPSPVLPVKTGISWWNDDVMPSSDLPEETDIFIFLWRNAVCWYPIEDWHCWNFDDVFPVLRFSTEDRIIIYFCDVMPSPGTPLKTELWWRIPVLTGRREDRQRRYDIMFTPHASWPRLRGVLEARPQMAVWGVIYNGFRLFRDHPVFVANNEDGGG